MPNKYDLILFDVDGTIADTDEMLRQTFYVLYDLYRGEERSEDEIIYYFSGPPIKETLKKEFPHLELDFIYDEYRKISESFYDSTICEIKDVSFVLNYFKNKGIKLGVVTNKVRKSTLKVLNLLKMNNIFDIIVGYDDVEKGKPDPMGINKAINFFNVPKDKVLYVGDNVIDDISAKNAGVDSAIIYFGKRKMPEDLKPNIKLYNFKDLISEVFYE